MASPAKDARSKTIPAYAIVTLMREISQPEVQIHGVVRATK